MITLANGLSWPEMIDGLRHDAAVREGLRAQLLAVPYDAYFWECCRVSDDAFECVVLEASARAFTPGNHRAFAEHLADPVATFESLGGDAMLIVPYPRRDYGHLAAFLKTASDAEYHALMEAVGHAIARWVDGSGRPSRAPDAMPWVSTAGMGVPWLHVRLDSRPKYYRHAPYRQGVARRSET